MDDEPHPISRASTGSGAAAAASLLWILLLAACSGPQSTLTPAGEGAERLASLLWWMAGGALLVWLGVVGLAVYLIRFRTGPHDERTANLLIIGGGVVFPTVVLTVLISYGLSLMPALLEPPAEPSLRIEASGEEWWWRFRYHPVDGEPVVSANELRLPVGEAVVFTVTSPDVIHSFWIPSLGGKIDMIPGRTTSLVLRPTREGSYRGVCAEYCGVAHALMAFHVEVVSPEEFEAWLEQERGPAEPPAGAEEQRGEELFLANGCGACHTVRGTEAAGRVGPDLTRVGSRETLGAGLLSNTRRNMEAWIAAPGELKPGVHMPGFGVVGDDEVSAMAAYLSGLR